MSSLHEWQYKIGDWHEKEFGTFTETLDEALWKKLEEEAYEAVHAEGSEVADELADVLIVTMALAHRYGINIEDALRRKFNIVRSRNQRQREVDRGLLPA